MPQDLNRMMSRPSPAEPSIVLYKSWTEIDRYDRTRYPPELPTDEILLYDLGEDVLSYEFGRSEVDIPCSSSAFLDLYRLQCDSCTATVRPYNVLLATIAADG